MPDFGEDGERTSLDFLVHEIGIFYWCHAVVLAPEDCGWDLDGGEDGAKVFGSDIDECLPHDR